MGGLNPIENRDIDAVFADIECKNDKAKTDFKVRFSKLESQEERDLIMDLTKRFTFIPLSEYGNLLVPTVEKFLGSIGRNKKISVINGLRKVDWGKVKSNYLVSYQFKGLNLIKIIDWGKYPLKVFDDYKSLLQTNDIQNHELLMVDDFLGTGETIEGAYKYIANRLEVYNKNMPHVSVVCIVAMQRAVDLLMKMGIKVYAYKIVKRGISDYYKGQDLVNATALMETIEKRIKVNKTNKFGYHQSEALVCMERCPNNTFPFFWYNLKYGNPPFRR